MPSLINKEDFCIIIFAKAPILGHVKTRLARDMDDSVVVNLYRNFVLDIVQKIKSIKIPYKIFYDPPGTEHLMTDWLGADNKFIRQQGADLGERMKNAFTAMFEDSFTRAVIIGTDFPDLPVKYILEAFAGLEKSHAVIGPTFDGGYYLIGFNNASFLSHAFDNIPWGTNRVFQNTMALFNKKKLSVHVLPGWRDIDTYDDLKNLIKCLEKNPASASNTFQFLESAGMIN